MSTHQGEYGSHTKLMIADITAMTMPAMRAQLRRTSAPRCPHRTTPQPVPQNFLDLVSNTSEPSGARTRAARPGAARHLIEKSRIVWGQQGSVMQDFNRGTVRANQLTFEYLTQGRRPAGAVHTRLS